MADSRDGPINWGLIGRSVYEAAQQQPSGSWEDPVPWPEVEAPIQNEWIALGRAAVDTYLGGRAAHVELCAQKMESTIERLGSLLEERR